MSSELIKAKHDDPDRDHYFELIKQFPLRPLRSETDLTAAISVIDSLIVRDRDDGEQDYLDVLTDIVEKYESDTVPMSPVSDAEMLRHLLGARGITQAKLAEDIGIADSTIREILRGKRKLNRKHLGQVSRYFNVAPAVFSI